MIYLISSEEIFDGEIALIQQLFLVDPDFVFHVRKPNLSAVDTEKWLSAFDSNERARMVLHQHHSLSTSLGLMGIHQKEEARVTAELGDYISTSFHSLSDAIKGYKAFSYFFCSPIFKSFSKSDYLPTESWNIIDESFDFRNKAVALGGIDSLSIPQARQKGFQNFAVMGAIWQSEFPVRTFQTICELCSTNDHTV